jgi:hypothetical protein
MMVETETATETDVYVHLLCGYYCLLVPNHLDHSWRNQFVSRIVVVADYFDPVSERRMYAIAEIVDVEIVVDVDVVIEIVVIVVVHAVDDVVVIVDAIVVDNAAIAHARAHRSWTRRKSHERGVEYDYQYSGPIFDLNSRARVVMVTVRWAQAPRA